MNEDSFTNCSRHGRVRWEGTVECEDCGAVFQTKDGASPRFAPSTCTCGAKLLLSREAEEDETSSARASCSLCFVDRMAVAVTVPAES